MASRKKLRSHSIKEKAVKEIIEEIKKSKTLVVVSIKGLPSRQFQEIKKSIRNNAKVRVAKKNILLRVVKGLGKDSALKLEDYIKENCAFIISNIEGFELAGILLRKRSSVFAKAGQIATSDIEVKDGPTDLPPGPAISELGSLGLVVSVESGKIAIKKSKIVVRQGEIIKDNVASVLQKLGIQPFNVGLEPVCVYDVQTEKIYSELKIDPDLAIQELKNSAGKALGFAQRIKYFCRETIGYFLVKANMEGTAINNKINPQGGNQ
jgi:large subunit ribosomal protein L10